jgi:hypothetical protein
MKPFASVFITLSVLAASLLNVVAAQQLSYIPGPANLDTSRFAHIYFLRENTDEYPDNWFGVIMNNDAGLSVKIKMNSIYRVNTVRTGKNTFWIELRGVRESVTLELFPGSNYYIEIRPEKIGQEVTKANLALLKDDIAQARIAAFDGKVQERYMIMPYPSDQTEFTQNRWPDTVRFYADKKSRYTFLPLPSWESIMNTTLLTAFGFRNKEISTTYSEAGGLLYLPRNKYATEKDFEEYCQKGFVEGNMITALDSVVGHTIIPVKAPQDILYARLVTIDSRKVRKKDSEDPPLYIRSTFVVFCRINRKGKQETAAMYTSERGLPEELHSKEELERRMLGLWDSFTLFKIPED